MSAEPSRPVRTSAGHYCQQHPDKGWTDRPCDHESHRHERFAKFLRELMGLPTEREIRDAEPKKGTL